MDHEDWNTVTFKKYSKPVNNEPRKENKIISEEDDLPIKQKQTEKKEQQSMMQSRLAYGYKTQKDLANATNGKITTTRINEIESGRGNPPSGFEKSLLFKLLKIKFNK